jgi:hypothetical protein
VKIGAALRSLADTVSIENGWCWMGFSTMAAEFLAQAKAQGLQLGQTLTLGRQSMFISPVRLARLLKSYGCFPAGMSDDQFFQQQFTSPYVADPFLRILGATSVTSMDMSDYEASAIRHDLNLPVPPELHQRFDTVIDGGTLEHVFNFPVAIRSCMEMVKVGGTVIIITPANNYFGHGFYQFSAELMYRVFSAENGFEVQRMHVAENEIFEGRLAGRQLAVEHLGRRYAVSDPAKLKRRVLLATKRPVIMIVQARRIAQRSIFEQTPQQSDYEAAWQSAPSAAAAPPAEQNPKRQFKPNWAKLKDMQLHWLPKLCRLNPLFFAGALRRRSLRNRENFKPV